MFFCAHLIINTNQEARCLLSCSKRVYCFFISAQTFYEKQVDRKILIALQVDMSETNFNTVSLNSKSDF